LGSIEQTSNNQGVPGWLNIPSHCSGDIGEIKRIHVARVSRVDTCWDTTNGARAAA